MSFGGVSQTGPGMATTSFTDGTHSLYLWGEDAGGKLGFFHEGPALVT